MLTLIIVLSYLLGSVSGSLMLGRLRGVDIRTMGSGNAGGTNALRTQGIVFALGVALIDVGKGVLAAYLAQRWLPESPDAAYLAVFAAVVVAIWRWRGPRMFTMRCIKCGTPFCRRCHLGAAWEGLCTQCHHLFVVRDGVATDARPGKVLRRRSAR